MPLDENTYWRATFTARARGEIPKITKVYVIAISRAKLAQVQTIACAEVSRIFQRHCGQVVTKPLGGFVQVTHPERSHDLLSENGHPVWIERWMGKR